MKKLTVLAFFVVTIFPANVFADEALRPYKNKIENFLTNDGMIEDFEPGQTVIFESDCQFLYIDYTFPDIKIDISNILLDSISVSDDFTEAGFNISSQKAKIGFTLFPFKGSSAEKKDLYNDFLEAMNKVHDHCS